MNIVGIPVKGPPPTTVKNNNSCGDEEEEEEDIDVKILKILK